MTRDESDEEFLLLTVLCRNLVDFAVICPAVVEDVEDWNRR